MPSDLEVKEPTRRNWLSYSGLAILTGLNAFNDNFTKFTLIPLAGWLAIGVGASSSGFTIAQLLALLMVLPYILFAPTSGWIADRFPKNIVVRWAAWLQLVVIAMMVLAIHQKSLTIAIIGFFFLAIQSTVLGPAKVGILKEILGSKRLSLGSGILEGVTILTILAGQIAAGLIFDHRLADSKNGWEAAFSPVVLLLIGSFVAVALSRLIERTPSHDAGPLNLKVAFRHVHDFNSVWTNRPLRLSALGVAFFWGFASFINLAVYEVASQLHGGKEGTGTALSIMMAAASVGIASGSIFAGILSRKGTELGLVPVGGTILTAGTLILGLAPLGSVAFLTGLFVAGGGAAIFLVPLKAHLLDLSPNHERGKILSVSGLMNNIAGLTAIIMQLTFNLLGMSISLQMLALMLGSIWATWFVMKILPRNFWKFIGIRIIRSLYRIRVQNIENIPAEGGVILCPNHLTFVDALVMTSACPREVRFLIAEKCYRRKWVGKFARTFNAVPVSSERAKEAIRLAADEAKAGNVVCLFPEGQLSRSGTFNELKRGFEMIARKADCPVVPAYMHGLWGTFTSFAGGRYLHKLPRRLGSGLTVGFGEPIPPKEASSKAVAAAWHRLASQAIHTETIKHSRLSTHSHLLGETPMGFDEEREVLEKMSQEEYAPLAYQARELLAISTFHRGDKVLIEWETGEAISRVLAYMLPSIAGVKVALVPRGASESDILEVVKNRNIDRLVLQRNELSDEFIARLHADEKPVHVINDWEGQESLLATEGVYPSLLHDGVVYSWSLPHPDEDSPMAQFQPGWMTGSAGKILNGAKPPAGWDLNKENFLIAKTTEQTKPSE